jgi:hypothetical protein
VSTSYNTDSNPRPAAWADRLVGPAPQVGPVTRAVTPKSIAKRAALAAALAGALGLGAAAGLAIVDPTGTAPAPPAAVAPSPAAGPSVAPMPNPAPRAAASACPSASTAGRKMYGDPATACPYWRPQHSSDCVEMSVADMVGQITGNEPTEQEITTLAQHTLSKAHPGPIWHPGVGTSKPDNVVLLQHYGIHAVSSDDSARGVPTGIAGLRQDLAQGRKVLVGVNAETIWNKPGDRTTDDHGLVVIGIDTGAGVVHLNDSGIKTGQDEQVPLATFTRAWATSHDFKTVTDPAPTKPPTSPTTANTPTT